MISHQRSHMVILNQSYRVSSFIISDLDWIIVSVNQHAVFVLVTDGTVSRPMPRNAKGSREYLIPDAQNAMCTELTF